jgi:hypothetical protein
VSSGGLPGIGGVVSSGGIPGVGGMSTGGVTSTGGSGGTSACSDATCTACCDEKHPGGRTEFALNMYECACYAETCYALCGESLCNNSTPDPSLDCLQCMYQLLETNDVCFKDWSECSASEPCHGYGDCAFSCF